MPRTLTHPDQLASVQDPRRVVVVTGCSEGGIGWHLAATLGTRAGASHYRVFATARSMEKMRTLPSQVERVIMDVCDQKSVDDAIASIIEEAGRIDVLINNAGVNAGVGPAVEVDVERYKATYEANVFGVVRVTQAVTRHMIPYARKHGAARAGMIVNIGSTVGYVSLPYSAAYSSSKAAVHSISDAMRLELAPFGIKVIIVAPGKIKSSFGDNGQAFIETPGAGSNYAHVADQVVARAQYSQTGKSTPTRAFAETVVRHLERNGALGDGRALTWRGAYLTAGVNSFFATLLYYLPPFLKDGLITRIFKLARIGQAITAQSKKAR